MTAETFAIGVPDVTDETARNVPGTKRSGRQGAHDPPG